MNRDLFVYDGDCGLCQRTVDWLASRTDASIEFVPAVDAPADLALDATALNEAAVLVCSDGRRFWGSLAIGETLRRNERYGNNLLGRLILGAHQVCRPVDLPLGGEKPPPPLGGRTVPGLDPAATFTHHSSRRLTCRFRRSSRSLRPDSPARR